MGKRTREIVALVMLALLGLIVLAAMVWYIFIGHNWNIAASNIDESIGQMDGYTVILYEGQTLPTSERNRISSSQPLLDDENRGMQKPDEEPEQNEPVSMHEAASYYRQMGATVFMLKPNSPYAYDPPIVLNKNDFYIGIYYADGSTPRLEAQLRTADLKMRGVDFVVLLVNDARMLTNTLSSVDIIICTSDEELSSHGEYHDGTFCVDSPLLGQVQTIIISPSNVLTSKTITWL